MTPEKAQQIIVDWHIRMEKTVRCHQAIANVFGWSETEYGSAIDSVMDGYTRTVSDITGLDYDTLVAWWTEYDFGAKPMRIQIGDEDSWIPITTPKALAATLWETRS